MVSISIIFFSHFLGPGYSENCESISKSYWGGWDTRPVLIWRALQCWCQCNLIICCGTFDLWRKHNDNCLHPGQEGQTPLGLVSESGPPEIYWNFLKLSHNKLQQKSKIRQPPKHSGKTGQLKVCLIGLPIS